MVCSSSGWDARVSVVLPSGDLDGRLSVVLSSSGWDVRFDVEDRTLAAANEALCLNVPSGCCWIISANFFLHLEQVGENLPVLGVLSERDFPQEGHSNFSIVITLKLGSGSEATQSEFNLNHTNMLVVRMLVCAAANSKKSSNVRTARQKSLMRSINKFYRAKIWQKGSYVHSAGYTPAMVDLAAFATIRCSLQ